MSRTLSLDSRYAHNFQGVTGPGYGSSSNLIFVTLTYRPLQATPQPQQQQLQPPQPQLQQ
jgi:hypothetical protein